MVTKLYCYCKESFKTNKIDNNIEWLIKGYEKKSWDYETENLPWNNKLTYHQDYKEIRNLYYEAIKYIESQKNYREIFKNRLHRERQTKIIAGSIARFLVIQIVKTNREFGNIDDKIEIHNLPLIDKKDLKPLDFKDLFQVLKHDINWYERIKVEILLNSGILDKKSIIYDKSTIINSLRKNRRKKKLLNNLIIELTLEIIIFFKRLIGNNKFLIVDSFIFSKCKFFDSRFFQLIWSLHQKTISYKFFKRRLKKIKAFRSIKFKSKKKVLNQNLETFKYLWHLFSPISIDNGLNETLERANYIFPKKVPKFIITSTAFFSDEIFNMYTAKAIENKTKYKIIQHGGGFGFSEFNDEEELQISVADEFLTWGWDRSYVSIPKDTKRAKIIPFGSLLLPSKSAKNRSNKPRNTKHKKEIYICISEWSFNDFRLYCYPTSHGQKRKQKDLISMVSSLKPKIRENVSFRLHSNGIYNLREILTKELGTFKFNDRAKDDVSDGLLSNARLYIGDSNSTTWLESLVINIPTLLFLSDEYLDHNKNILVINKAVENKMIFSSSTDLANWLNINYQDINKWWKSKQIQRIRKDLVKKFSDEIDLVKYKKKYSDIINLSEITLNGRNG